MKELNVEIIETFDKYTLKREKENERQKAYYQRLWKQAANRELMAIGSTEMISVIRIAMINYKYSMLSALKAFFEWCILVYSYSRIIISNICNNDDYEYV